jgi:hypothetical protein
MSAPAKTRAKAPHPRPHSPAPIFYRPGNYQPEDSVGYLMRRILHTFSLAVEHELEPSGLTNAQ